VKFKDKKNFDLIYGRSLTFLFSNN